MLPPGNKYILCPWLLYNNNDTIEIQNESEGPGKSSACNFCSGSDFWTNLV